MRAHTQWDVASYVNVFGEEENPYFLKKFKLGELVEIG